MGTIDMSQVAGFKAVDAEGNELGVVSMSELTASISEQVLQTIVMRNQANTLEQPVLMSSASTLAAANDAFENELQQVSDANWVRALLADGTPVLWNKSDLASVVGGLLKSGKLYPYMNRGAASGDLFSDMDDGYYSINMVVSPITNSPCDYGVMTRFSTNYGYAFMEINDVINKVKYLSTRTSTKWSEWVRI